MLVTTKEMFEIAQKEKFAIPAPDFYDSQSAQAYIQVAEELNMPLILSFAEVHLDFLTLKEAAAIGKVVAEEASIPVALHLDHGMTLDVIKEAIDLGFSSVMIDASSETFEVNVERTKEIIEYAHPRGVVVEAEIGHVGSGENYENHEETDSLYTTPSEAAEFVKLTGVDSLAVSIGTAHGVYKGEPEIKYEVLEEISKTITTPLVLHGGSSSGDANLKKCAKNGISKINIFTDIVNAAYQEVENNPTKNIFEIREVAMNGMKKCLKHYYEVFETKTIIMEDENK